MTFEDYLIEKKIDGNSFKVGEPDRWNEWSVLFEQMSAASFTAQKLYLINPVRRKYPLAEMPGAIKPEALKPSGRPVFKPKIK